MSDERKEKPIKISRRSPEEVQEQFMIKMAEFQLRDRFNNEKMQIAIKTLRLLETSDRLPLAAIRAIALKGLDDIASIGNPQVDGQEETQGTPNGA